MCCATTHSIHLWFITGHCFQSVCLSHQYQTQYPWFWKQQSLLADSHSGIIHFIAAGIANIYIYIYICAHSIQLRIYQFRIWLECYSHVCVCFHIEEHLCDCVDHVRHILMLIIGPGMTNCIHCCQVMDLLIWKCVMVQAPVWQPMGTLFHIHLCYQIQWRHCLRI